MIKDITNEGFQSLAAAVIKLAAKDYARALITLADHPDSPKAKGRAVECRQFFLSEHFSLFSDLDGMTIERKIRESVV